ncbi:hypothetical protein RFI_36775 [Reticulomyxa filosa]|uniref:Uncharacterized protein n=1 Tax=Reticulomyxa filosa TaxID=46433 RepID=X6LIX1_RETFI|nr:hypothetical protein RFI_36775 [Reticulomyxa filosa]|eukprot:ETO00665.1 hypothetical protein RFI_36775 [Reticulomyxa filosa]
MTDATVQDWIPFYDLKHLLYYVVQSYMDEKLQSQTVRHIIIDDKEIDVWNREDIDQVVRQILKIVEQEGTQPSSKSTKKHELVHSATSLRDHDGDSERDSQSESHSKSKSGSEMNTDDNDSSDDSGHKDNAHKKHTTRRKKKEKRQESMEMTDQSDMDGVVPYTYKQFKQLGKILVEQSEMDHEDNDEFEDFHIDYHDLSRFIFEKQNDVIESISKYIDLAGLFFY